MEHRSLQYLNNIKFSIFPLQPGTREGFALTHDPSHDIAATKALIKRLGTMTNVNIANVFFLRLALFISEHLAVQLMMVVTVTVLRGGTHSTAGK